MRNMYKQIFPIVLVLFSLFLISVSTIKTEVKIFVIFYNPYLRKSNYFFTAVINNFIISHSYLHNILYLNYSNWVKFYCCYR